MSSKVRLNYVGFTTIWGNWEEVMLYSININGCGLRLIGLVVEERLGIEFFDYEHLGLFLEKKIG